jgi:hypothetical protein
VVGDRAEQEHGGDGRQHQAGQIQVALTAVQADESDRERQREQEAEQHLHAEADDPQLLDQLGQVAVVTLGDRLRPRTGDSLGPLTRLRIPRRPRHWHLLISVATPACPARNDEAVTFPEKPGIIPRQRPAGVNRWARVAG